VEIGIRFYGVSSQSNKIKLTRDVIYSAHSLHNI
jgi:hypothetical protein